VYLFYFQTSILQTQILVSEMAMTIWSGRDEDALPVALRSDLQVTTFDQVVGPGRLLHQAYAVAGHGVEKALGRTAHKLGLGPTAATRRIERG